MPQVKVCQTHGSLPAVHGLGTDGLAGPGRGPPRLSIVSSFLGHASFIINISHAPGQTWLTGRGGLNTTTITAGNVYR